tara:strand:+ start:219 stop:761 length:543 start_codon:yes stop_codon:yes gene_type:complete
MSTTFLNFTCDKCSFQGDSLVTFGGFYWSHKEKTFQIDQQLGLCSNCDEIVAMEKLPDSYTMKRAREIRKDYTGQPLFQIFEKDYAKYLASQEGFELLERVIALKRRPVCLKCGGNKVQAIELPSNASGSIPIKIGIKHPNCSGNLKVHGSGGVRLGMNPIKYIYDIYGKLTSTIEGYDN